MVTDLNAIPGLAMLNDGQCELVHRASLEILRPTGVWVFRQGPLDLLRQTDAVLEDDNLVRFPPRRQPCQPTFFDRRCHEGWVAVGHPRSGQRLREKTLAILVSHQPESLPDGVRQEIASILSA